MSAMLKVDVVCDVAMTSTLNVLTTELRDLLYDQSIDNTCYSFFICRIRDVIQDLSALVKIVVNFVWDARILYSVKLHGFEFFLHS